MAQKDITSPKKIAKAAAKLYRKEMREEAEQRGRELGKLIGNAMKPKPKYIPWKLWLWGMRLFIRIES